MGGGGGGQSPADDPCSPEDARATASVFAARRTRLRRRRPGTSDGVGSHAQPSAGGSGRQGVGGSVDGQARATASPATLSHPRAAAARLVAVQLTILITVQLTVLVAVIQLAVHQPGRGEKSESGGGGVPAQPAPLPTVLMIRSSISDLS
ncbi:hypothetical protein [Oryza sativa Japonica Group]|uniref:Uncharacterized protein n=1 Tax=Oryza sativa subsp. japonica TaxID=39947 RepID=Q657D2_ORYSJ|nr:hypothetical protein [Oryza sativa Japonica Group]BAD45085.1 hypothetical protein [Oryza sativa Japonica Group]